MTTTKIPYQGTTPDADDNDYVLFSTTVAFPAYKCGLQMAGFKRLIADLGISQAGTLREEKSDNRGTNWTVVSSEAISVPGTGTVYREYAVEAYDDYRLIWENGSSAQATWEPSLALDTEAF
jgi:hypothetical protein